MQLYRVAVAAAANNDGAEKEKKMKGLAGWSPVPTKNW